VDSPVGGLESHCGTLPVARSFLASEFVEFDVIVTERRCDRAETREGIDLIAVVVRNGSLMDAKVSSIDGRDKRRDDRPPEIEPVRVLAVTGPATVLQQHRGETRVDSDPPENR